MCCVQWKFDDCICQLPLQIIPNMFNGIYVWRLRSPQQDLHIIALQPILGLLASAFGIVVPLEYDALGSLVIKCKATLQIILRNLDVMVPIYPPLNIATPLHNIQPQIIQDPLPNFKHPSTSLSFNLCHGDNNRELAVNVSYTPETPTPPTTHTHPLAHWQGLLQPRPYKIKGNRPSEPDLTTQTTDNDWPE